MRIILNKTRNSIRRGNEGAILFALHMLYKQLHNMKHNQSEAGDTEAVWWDAAYVQDYVGCQ